MNVAAFVLIALLFAAYVVLDGYDLGAGAMHLFLGRTEHDRRATLAAIGPFWNGNEVMLIAAAAVLFALFPRAYAAAFSGFYLPFMVALWLLMIRGIAIELRGHFRSDLWHGFWDAAFSVSSALLAFIFGVAIGNIVRGLPLDANGYFAGTFSFLLNPYAAGVGLLALVALAMHGAAFVWWRSPAELGKRARAATLRLWPAVAIVYAAVTWTTLQVHPVHAAPLLWVSPAVGLAALLAVIWRRESASVAFAATSVFLLMLVVSAAATIFPFLLPSFPIGTGGLDIVNAAPPHYALTTGFAVAATGLAAVLVYSVVTARRIVAES